MKAHTLIAMANRLLAVRQCDALVVLSGGRLVAQGPYEEILLTSPAFRAMAEEPRPVAAA